jgi:glutamate/aspartate transport system substrate-binding protein
MHVGHGRYCGARAGLLACSRVRFASTHQVLPTRHEPGTGSASADADIVGIAGFHMNASNLPSSLMPSALLCALACMLAPVHAQPTDTLKKIAATGTINLGHRESSIPFSYYDPHRQVVGYSQELMLRVLDFIKAELGLPALTIKLVPVTSQNRIPLVQNGSVDLECGSTTHNAQREQQAAFSVSIFVIGTRLMVHRESGIRDFADLQDHRVVVTAGTTSERLLRTFNERTSSRLSIIAAKDHDEAFDVLENGPAQAFMMDDALLYGERAKAKRPADWIVVGTPMSSEVYGCMMRRDDPNFKRVVDRGLKQLMISGEALKIYMKWFQQPIPPKNLNLNWPPSQALLELFRHPDDNPQE